MGATTVEPSQPIQVEENQTAVATEYLRQCETEARLGRGILSIIKDREDRGLTPFVNGTRFDQADILAVRKRHQSEALTDTDVSEARRASVGLALEMAAQITEVQLPRTAGVNEDLKSLEDMIQGIRLGSTSVKEYTKDNPSILIQEARKVIARRQKISPEQVKLTDQQLIAYAQEQYEKAFRRLSKGAEALRGYFGR